MNTMALIDKIAADLAAKGPVFGHAHEPVFRRYWKAPKNALGGFKSYDDMKREMAAERAANYGPPQGPCSNPRSLLGYHIPTCRCGWHMGAHNG